MCSAQTGEVHGLDRHFAVARKGNADDNVIARHSENMLVCGGGAAYVHAIKEVNALADTLRSYATDIKDALIGKGSSHIASFVTTMNDLSNDTEIDVTNPDTLQTYRDSLCDTNNIGVEALYNQRNKLQYVTDHFMEYVNDEISFDTEDEAQRIRLITYYTFNSIPIEQNWELLINYRLYAN